MKLNKEEFRKLREYWYQKLEEIGFEDIEELKGDDLVFKKNCNTVAIVRNETPFSFQMKEEYFRCMAQKAYDPETTYRNEIDKIILTKHADGAKIKTILNELSAIGVMRDRKSIRIIIRRYEMSWHIRHYDRKLLHLKEIK